MFPRTLPANHVDTVFSKDDFTAEVAKLKEDETTSVKQFEAGQLEGIFFFGVNKVGADYVKLVDNCWKPDKVFFCRFFFPDL